jgi:hypothetical protein
MNWLSPPVVVSFLAPALALTLLLTVVAGAGGLKPRGLAWCGGLFLASLGLAALPLQGLPLARWLAGIIDHWSVPLLALLAAAVVRRLFGIECLRRSDRLALWIFGVLAGLALYPAALGSGPLDPFSLGWQAGPLFAAMALLSALLLWRGCRLGGVIVAAIAAWHLRVPESGNYWDCLVDPIYFLVSLGALMLEAGRGFIRRAAPEQGG